MDLERFRMEELSKILLRIMGEDLLTLQREASHELPAIVAHKFTP